MKPPADLLFVITGPTACGKTLAAIELAKRIGGEIVSADSMQVYQGMDIGTAKPTPAEQDGIPHHMIDIVRPDEPFSAARFQAMASAAIRQIHSRGNVPILTGGTGFYINAVVYENDFTPTAEKETEYRRQLADLAATKGEAYLHSLLQAVDPVSAAIIHPRNVKRVARALSFYHFTGKTISTHNVEQRVKAPVYDTVFVVLNMPRETLYTRINARVAMMMDMGLVGEVQGLLAAGYHEELVSMQGLGYKETARYLRGQYSLADAAEAIRTGTRHYAKRQLTWFTHRAPHAHWLHTDGSNVKALAEQMERLMVERGA